MIAAPTTRPIWGLFACPFCSDDGLVDADVEHTHDGFCGDRVWADDLPGLPRSLSVPASDWSDDARSRLEAVCGVLPDDATFLDVLLTLIDVLREKGREALSDILNDDNEHWPTCPCCGRLAELVTPLVPLDRIN